MVFAAGRFGPVEKYLSLEFGPDCFLGNWA